jgi:hypothetical protein
VARPAKSLEAHVREGTFRARRHARLLAGVELPWPTFAAIQRQYRQAAPGDARTAIARAFERAVRDAHRELQQRRAREGIAGGGAAAAPSAGSRRSTAEPGARPSVPRLALSPDEAAEALGVSSQFFHEHIAPQLRVARLGGRTLVSIVELDRWLLSTCSGEVEP